MVVASAVWALALAPIVLSTFRPEVEAEPLGEKLRAFGVASARGAARDRRGARPWWRCCCATSPTRRLARVGTLLLGVGYALLVGGIDALGYAAAPAAVAVAVVAALAWRRRRSGARLGEAERLVRILAGVLCLGSALPLALETQSPELATAGLALIGAFIGAVLLGLLPLAAAGFLDMRGSVEWFIATRYLFAKRRQTFISVITLICVAGVAAGVWLIITVLSVMNGFERTWREEIIGNRAHFTIQPPAARSATTGALLEVVDGVPGVVGASPYVDGEGMVRGERGEIVAVRVRGIDPDAHRARHRPARGLAPRLRGRARRSARRRRPTATGASRVSSSAASWPTTSGCASATPSR